MKSLRKSILTLLALTLFGGAWAQGQLLTTINASSGFTNGTQTFDNIVTVTLDDASYDANNGWYSSGSPRPVEVAPVNGVTVTGYMLYFSSSDPMEFEGSSFTVALEGDMVWDDEIITQLGFVGITKIEVYGTAPAQAIELTKSGANQWTLGQTPDYDLELQVEYYEAHALKEIPAGWTVKVNGDDKTNLIAGDSLMITETDSVTLIPPAEMKPNVKSVTLVEPVTPTITVTINQSDWPNSGNSFTKDGVTVSAGMIDAMYGDIYSGGSFSTTLGNFTSIVVTTYGCYASGTGWSGDMESMTWSGTPASSVSFSGEFMGMGMVQTIIVCTIQPNN